MIVTKRRSNIRRVVDEPPIPPPDKFELFIGCAGADERAYTNYRRLCDWKTVSRAIFFRFDERTLEATNTGIEARYDAYRKMGPPPAEITAKLSNRANDLAGFIQMAKPLAGDARVALDISVFTKPYFFAILRALQDYLRIEHVYVYYTEPETYAKPRGRWGFSSGDLELIEIPGFNGLNAAAPKVLLVLLGFEGNSAGFVVNELQPERTVAVNGFPAYFLHYKEISLLENASLFGDQADRNEVRYAPANDPFETYNVLEELLRNAHGKFITIAPLGTKPMALGAALYGLNNEQVRILYPAPEEYASKPSNNIGRSWVYTIPLSPPKVVQPETTSPIVPTAAS